jgi:hypothetical protein
MPLERPAQVIDFAARAAALRATRAAGPASVHADGREVLLERVGERVLLSVRLQGTALAIVALSDDDRRALRRALAEA